MRLSKQAEDAAGARFSALLERAGAAKGREVLDALAQAEARGAEGEASALRWLYAASPLSDWLNYDASLFRSCAAHGVFLRERSPWAKAAPEDVFLNYVLHIRVNEEELSDCRREFYDQAADRVRGLTDTEAVIAANYWCAEQVAYRSTDERTISALGAYRSGYGRCGEESVFAVNVFRALGIPARQIYTPRWAHCDDNHAWVEVWCGGGWHFLGACEPEEALDRGWFASAASRAMVIHSRCFGAVSGEEVISRSGAATYLNHLSRYADTVRFTVSVRDESGAPVEGAQVVFGVLNCSNVFPAAATATGRDGTASLTCGLGSLHLRAWKGDAWRQRTVDTREAAHAELVLTREPPVLDRWEDFVSRAPHDRPSGGGELTEARKVLGRKKAAAAKEKRSRRVKAMYDPARAEAAVRRYGYGGAVQALLEESRGNLDRLLDFLEDERFAAGDKEALLLTLTAKDWRDADPEVLREALALKPPGDCAPWVLCPRVFREPLRQNRRFIRQFFSPEEQAAFRASPERIWDYLEAHIRFDPDLEYDHLATLPAGALAAGTASPLSKKILFVSVCRALGVPARLNPVDGEAEYDGGSGFRPVEPPEGGTGTLLLEKAPEETWQYGADFSVGRLAEGDYRTLDLSGAVWEGGRLAVPARAGDYRVITSNRLPNGDLYASRYHLRLEGGGEKAVRLRRHPAEPSAMLGSFPLEEFTVRDGAGRPVRGSELTRGKAVLMWLEEGREPTEHILGELLEREAEFRSLPADIVFLVRGPEALESARLRRVLKTFGGIRVYYDGAFGPGTAALARRLYVDHEKLPLIAVTSGPLHAVYASSGYNVGSGDMLLKICRLL